MSSREVTAVRGAAVKKTWDRLPACQKYGENDRLEAYPTNKITASEQKVG
jgi:hypothetical protein